MTTSFLEHAVQKGVFPGAVLLWGRPGLTPQTEWAGQRGLSREQYPVDQNLVYDLASLTKVMSTTILIMKAVDDSILELGTSLGEFFPAPPDLATISILQLLTHQSGLTPWRPFYLLADSLKTDDYQSRKQAVLSAILREKLVNLPGKSSLYSDLNFILLGFILELIHGKDISVIFDSVIAAPLGLKKTGFNPSWGPLAPTEDGPRHGGPIDIATTTLGDVPLGRVHDDNAAFLGGAAGHAGLFASAPELWVIVEELAQALKFGTGKIISGQTLKLFLKPRPASSGLLRAAGFDLGRPDSAAAGAAGHLGYTGCSFWWDWPKERSFIFLSNRVHPTAKNLLINDFRLNLASRLWSDESEANPDTE